MNFLKYAFIAFAVLSTSAFHCSEQSAPSVSIEFLESPIKQINTQSSAELGNFDINTTFSHGPKEIFTTGGLTQGKITSAYKVNFRTRLESQTQMACIWAEKVHIVLGYDPTIYIAREYPTNSCKYKNTLEHEIRHVNTDRITLKEYVPHIYNAMVRGTQQLSVLGPVHQNMLEAQQDVLQEQIKYFMRPIMEKLDSTRLQRQQLIDTRQEYLRLSNACQGQP